MTAVATRTILVVDDEPEVVDTVTEVLEMEGYRVETAADGVQALESVAHQMPDVILLDMKMPRMDGPTFAREFRDRYGYRIPIIGFTAAANCDGYAQEVWANGWVGKPFDMVNLVKTIQRHAH